MKEGAWIHAASGTYAWIDEHARWIQRRENSATFALPEDVITTLESITPDDDGPGRRALLLVAMEAGMVRFRGHGAVCTLEGTLPWIAQLKGAAQFLDVFAGEHLIVQVHDLYRLKALCAPWGVIQHVLEKGHPEELQPLLERCQVRTTREIAGRHKRPRRWGFPFPGALQWEAMDRAVKAPFNQAMRSSERYPAGTTNGPQPRMREEPSE